jgi:serine/threonine protein phosphatase PrpC
MTRKRERYTDQNTEDSLNSTVPALDPDEMPLVREGAMRTSDVRVTDTSTNVTQSLPTPNPPHHFEQTANDQLIASVAETIGNKPDRTAGIQQDAAYIAYVRNKEAIENPEVFFKKVVQEAQKKNATQRSGCTFSAALIHRDSDEVKITTANLGDSRTAIVFRGTTGDFSLILTQDHDFESTRHRPSDERMAAAVAEFVQNGKYLMVNKGKPNCCALAMSGAVGDGLFGDLLAREPEVWQYKLSDLVSYGASQGIGEVCDVHLINSCDGLYEGPISAAQTCVEENGIKSFKAVPSQFTGLFGPTQRVMMHDLVRQHDEYLAGFDSGEFHLRPVTLARYLTEEAMKHGSTDNISVNVVTLMQDKKIVCGTKPILASVCDGHGLIVFDRSKGVWTINKQPCQPGYEPNPKTEADGSAISSATAAMLFVMAQAEEIPGLEIGDERLALRSQIEIYKAIAGGASQDDTSITTVLVSTQELSQDPMEGEMIVEASIRNKTPSSSPDPQSTENVAGASKSNDLGVYVS